MQARVSSIDLLKKLLAFDTTSRNSNLQLIDFARDYLDGFGVKSELVRDETGKKANLYATVGPQDKAGFMLSGHTDVVPVDGQEWHSDPFKPVEKDDKLYARGACDMKSFVAVALALVPDIIAAKPKTPIHLGLTYDEEIGCIGVRPLMEALKQRPIKPKLCIIGEPTMMVPMTANKGKSSYLCHVRGHEGHSAMTHLGVNAVEIAAELVAKLRAMAKQRRERGPFDKGFDPPYSTIHTGVIQGGTQLNIIPRDCSFEFEVRNVPDEDMKALRAELDAFAATLLPEMRAVAKEAGIRVEEHSVTPALSARSDDEVVQLALALSGANTTGKVSFTTEGGVYQEGGIPTVVCGPGSIDQAHRPDEFIALDQIRQCESFVRRLIERAAR